MNFTGNMRGQVVDTNDPLGKGRVRVRVFGVYDDLTVDNIPWAEYADPLMGGGIDSGGSFIPDEGDKVWVFFEAGDHRQPVYFAGAPSMKDSPLAISEGYPKNRMFKTKAGHMISLSDEDGNETIRIVHKSGTYTEYQPDGSIKEVVVGNLNREVKGNLSETVLGSRTLNVVGNSDINIQGDLSTVVGGNTVNSSVGEMLSISGGMHKLQSATVVDISGTKVTLNEVGVGVILTPNGDLVPSEAYAVTQSNASQLLSAAGGNAPFDEPGETIPEGWPEPTADDPVEQPTEITGENNAPPLSVECENVTTVDYNYKLSDNYTVRDLTLKPLFKHPLVAQNGLSISDIVCNMKGLAVNILEPLRKQYPDIHINSGFRVARGNSQHNKGMAVDIQVSGWPPRKYSEVAKWIVDNLVYDQIIFEHGNSIWLHISYDRTKATQRRQKLTYYPRNSPQYKPGLMNYYDNKKVIS